ncbi:unnamed protein product [Mytilus edulis]|uniref:Uncharacterized protein n=1 Tax=Mytilus edulis TaxID=6550 RepID=A0A8S3TJ14_MYTED|nr:unnamed protein product [Mytilus edulis]
MEPYFGLKFLYAMTFLHNISIPTLGITGKRRKTDIVFKNFWRKYFNCNEAQTLSVDGETGTLLVNVFSTRNECIQLYTRKCDNPVPGSNSTYCDGDSVKNESCIIRGCPGIWSSWEENGQCSTTCGNGTEIRRRRCDNTAPTNDGDECPCDNITYVHCNTKECPDTLKTVQLRHSFIYSEFLNI